MTRPRANIGVPIHITQYDVAKENDSLQKEVPSRQFPVFWESPHVAGLIKNGGVERPALAWLREHVAKNPIQPMPIGGMRNDGSIQGASTGIGLRPTREDRASRLPNGAPKDLTASAGSSEGHPGTSCAAPDPEGLGT